MSKKNFINQTHLEGYLYSHKLEEAEAGPTSAHPGTKYIRGDIFIATDEERLNVIPVHYTYVTPTTNSGAANRTYAILKNIIDGKIGTHMDDGPEKAAMVRVDSSIALNEWHDQRDPNHPLVSQKRNEGGFIHLVTDRLKDIEERATFNTDIVITSTKRIEANDERGLPEKVIVKGYIFNFRGDVLPVEYSVLSPRPMDYFENIGATKNNPVFTRVSGQQVSQTIVKKVEEASAWGDTKITTVSSSYKDFVITFALPVPYEWNDESTLTAEELAEKLAKRELDLAELTKREDTYRKNKASAAITTNKATYDF